MSHIVVAPSTEALPSVVQTVMRDKLCELVGMAVEADAVAALLDSVDGVDGELRSRIILPDGRAIRLTVMLSMFETAEEEKA